LTSNLQALTPPKSELFGYDFIILMGSDGTLIP